MKKQQDNYKESQSRVFNWSQFFESDMEKNADIYRIINMFFVGQSGSVRVSDDNVSLQTPSQCS